MTLMWTAAASILYGEIAFIIILLLPYVSSTIWSKIFKSNFVRKMLATCKIGFICVVAFMGFMCADAIRESIHYTEAMHDVDISTMNPQGHTQIQVRAFRSQRNLYISGMALFLMYVVWRLCQLITNHANLLASSQASIRQAESATAAARQMMDENDKLKKELKVTDLDAVKQLEKFTADSVSEMEEELRETKCELNETRNDFSQIQDQLSKAENCLIAMKAQSDGVRKEYDRLLDEYNKLQVQLSGEGDKKDD